MQFDIQRFAALFGYQVRKMVKGGSRVGRDYQFDQIDFPIAIGDRVLDIGSGQHPFPLATHLADFKLEDNFDRGGAALVKDSRPFFVINIESMPFRADEFDFVYCSHVLEHVDDPILACKEIMRVGKKGYIETPTRASDMLFNFSRLHRWHVAQAENTLIFIEYSDRERQGTGIRHFIEEFRNDFENPVKQLIATNRDLFCNMFLWDGSFSVHVINKNGKYRSFAD